MSLIHNSKLIVFTGVKLFRGNAEFRGFPRKSLTPVKTINFEL